jgi:hypothetical protein
MNMTLFYSIILDMTLLYLLIFLILMFLVYFDYMLGIVGLVLYSNIRLYSSHSLDPWVSGQYCVGMVSIPYFPAFAPYISGRVVVRWCDIPVESFVVHPSSVGPVGHDYEERIALFLIFLSNVPMRRYKPVLP